MKAILGSLIGLISVLSVSAQPLVEGRVRLDSGEPVADAQVRLFDMTDLRQGAIARALTDGTGYFALPLAALRGRALPEDFALGPNYPNPFNPSTIIPYQLAASSQVRLEVFNLLGQRIATLVDGERPAGFHTARWHATDAAGRAVGAGVYIYRMTVGAASQTGRMVLIDGQAGVAAASGWPSASWGGGSDREDAQVYGLIVSGEGLVPYMDSSFRVEAGMAPVELVVSAGSHSAGKATDDACALCGFFGGFNDQQEEEAATDSTSSAGGPDLIVQSPSASAVALTPGQTFTLQVTVQNQGDQQAEATTLHYYRSNNTTITASDTEVGTDAVDALAASATSAQSIELTASVGVEKYYGACVESVRGEINTDNNCSSAVKITVSGQEATEGEEDTTEKPEEEDTSANVGADLPVTIPDANLRAAIAAALSKASGATITKGEMTGLTTLDARNAGISDLTGLEFATNLTGLWLYDNAISDISALAGLNNLEKLDLDDNAISDISALAGLNNLTGLGLTGNDISDISALAGLNNLTGLGLTGNDISDISALEGLNNLTGLWLYDNAISDISALAGLNNLEKLDLDDNAISDISALAGLNNLTLLDLTGNTISDISALEGLNNLTLLWLWNNDISDISALAGLNNLTSLDLTGNALSDISALAGLNNLTSLDLGNNDISDISALEGLNNLTSLQLFNNALSDISALAGLINLTRLWLGNNDISDISALAGLINLTLLWLDDNALSDISALAGLINLKELNLINNNISDISALSTLESSGLKVDL